MTVLRARILITLKPADFAWLAIVAIVIGTDLLCHPDHTLSKRFNLYKPGWLLKVVVLLTAGHLLRWLPILCDPWEWAWHADRRLRRHATRWVE